MDSYIVLLNNTVYNTLNQNISGIINYISSLKGGISYGEHKPSL